MPLGSSSDAPVINPGPRHSNSPLRTACLAALPKRRKWAGCLSASVGGVARVIAIHFSSNVFPNSDRTLPSGEMIPQTPCRYPALCARALPVHWTSAFDATRILSSETIVSQPLLAVVSVLGKDQKGVVAQFAT